MITTPLRFKNVGKYLDESSSRYESQFSRNVFVRVFRCSYAKAWKIQFLDFLGMDLDSINAHLEPRHSKKAVIEDIVWFQNELDFVERAEALSMKEGTSYNNFLVRSGKKARTRYKI